MLSEELIKKPEFVSRCQMLHVEYGSRMLQSLPGMHRSLRIGSSAEFSDYRSYEAGDNPDFIDWNVYARTENLYIKRHHEYEELGCHILVDTSMSMQPVMSMAKLCCATFMYMALANHDRARLIPFAQKFDQTLPVLRGAKSYWQGSDLLLNLKPRGKTLFEQLKSGMWQLQGRRSLTVLVSDLLSPSAIAFLKLLKQRCPSLMLFHTFDKEAFVPTEMQQWRLSDLEKPSEKRVVDLNDSGLTQQIRKRIDTFQTDIREYCRESEITYLPVHNSFDSLDEFFLYLSHFLNTVKV